MGVRASKAMDPSSLGSTNKGSMDCTNTKTIQRTNKFINCVIQPYFSTKHQKLYITWSQGGVLGEVQLGGPGQGPTLATFSLFVALFKKNKNFKIRVLQTFVFPILPQNFNFLSPSIVNLQVRVSKDSIRSIVKASRSINKAQQVQIR